MRSTPEGAVPLKVRSETVVEAVKTGKPSHILGLQHFDHAYPIIAEARCLRCHIDEIVNRPMAVLVVREDVAKSRSDALNRALIAFFLLVPIPVLMAFAVSRFVNSHLGDAVSKLSNKVHQVTTVSDLTQLSLDLETDSETLKFGELENIYVEVGSLISRIREVAVDREMLEFQIKVLERFVITSDEIRDWKQRVSYLLNEVNSVMSVNALFCVFGDTEKKYVIEVFWTFNPSEETRYAMEMTILQRINAEDLYCRKKTDLIVNHNIVSDTQQAQVLKYNDLIHSTKTIYPGIPQIGGILGVGIQSSLASEPSRSIVITSILTTLQNVIGSIKAISKYTKDLEYYATRDSLTNLFNQFR